MYLKPSISFDEAEAVVMAAVEQARNLDLSIVAVVVDEAGQMKALARMDGSWISALQVAIDKAVSAAVTTAPTSVWRSTAKSDPDSWFGLSSLAAVCPLAGGIPITSEGQVIGALGVSGGSEEQDESIAAHALGKLGLS